MNKYEFLEDLQKKLSCLPKREMRDRVNFYSEMIDDRIEDGMSEEEAVLAVGGVAEISSQMAESGTVKEKERRRGEKHHSVLGITLLILGSPVWLSLLIAFFAVILSLYVSFWAIIISMWAVTVSLFVGAFGGLCLAAYTAIIGYGFTALSLVAAAFVCLGLSMLFRSISRMLTISGVLIVKKAFCHKV